MILPLQYSLKSSLSPGRSATVQNLLALLDSALRSYLSPVGRSSTWFLTSLPGIFLGGWSAQGSDRYARVAVRTISLIQRSVVQALQKPEEDPLGESETLEQYESFLTQQLVTEVEKKRCLNLLDCAHQKFQNVLPTPELLGSSSRTRSRRSLGSRRRRRPPRKCTKERERGTLSYGRLLWVPTRAKLESRFVHSFSLVSISVHQASARSARSTGLDSCYLLPGVDYFGVFFLRAIHAFQLSVRLYLHVMQSPRGTTRRR